MATDTIKRILPDNPIDTSLRPAIDLLSQPIFLVDLSDQIIIANNAAQTTTGLQESALVGNPIATILSLNGRTQATSDKPPLGSLISLPATIHALKYTATFVSLSDLTYFAELTPRPAALVILTPLWSPQMQDQTTATIYEQFIGNLTLRITHDLSNSFTSIMMNAKLVHELLNDLLKTPTPEQCASLTDSGLPEIEDVIRKIREMAEFTKTLRDYAGQPPLNTHTLDLNSAISETLSLARILLGGKIQIDFLPSIELPPIYIDRFRVDRILLSILLSCTKAMPSGGSIVIKTERATLDQEFSLTHSGARPGTYTVLTIEDSSPGMDSERVTRVFDLPSSEIFDSASLSLPIVYSIVKRFGGYITVKSPLGQGTTFDIYFPSIPTPPSTSAVPDHVDEAWRSQSHEAPSPNHASLILVADDDPDIQQTIARYLSRELPRYQTTFAGDGETTLSLYKQFTDEGSQPALLIADLGLPKMDGRALALKVQQQFSSALILLTSGHTIETDPITAKTPEGLHFLQKPFEPNAFITTIKRLLNYENER
jgi:signal transduction histidine kinase/ActR/RegA family two-component response regulator